LNDHNAECAPYLLEFFEDGAGVEPCRVFLRSLDAQKRNIAVAALEEILAHEGKEVCRSDFGKPLGDGLFEFRIDLDEAAIRRRSGGGVQGTAQTKGHEGVLLRIFFHPYGEKIILLIAGYDKGADPKKRRQDREIKVAGRYLDEFRRNHAQAGSKPSRTKRHDVPKDRRFPPA
jgi:putative component of toxin-antitoxin plasmid stabilization module